MIKYSHVYNIDFIDQCILLKEKKNSQARPASNTQINSLIKLNKGESQKSNSVWIVTK